MQFCTNTICKDVNEVDNIFLTWLPAQELGFQVHVSSWTLFTISGCWKTQRAVQTVVRNLKDDAWDFHARACGHSDIILKDEATSLLKLTS